MAEMIPESITALRGATTGEKRIFRVLEQTLQPDSDFVVWYEPKTAHRRPDFLIWAHALGLLVIEAKDWNLESLKALTPNRWTLFHNEGEKVHESPLEQARSCAFHYKDLLARAPDLRQQSGPWQGHLLFPVGYCVAFTKITRQQATSAGLLDVLGTRFCLLVTTCTRTPHQKSKAAFSPSSPEPSQSASHFLASIPTSFEPSAP